MALSPQQRDALRSKIAHRVRDLPGSATVAAADKARRLKAEGRSVVDLSGGDPDFPTAAHVTEAAVASLNRGFTHYTPSRGIPELLKAIAAKLAKENGVSYEPAKEVLVTPGGKQALFTAAQALLDPGDEVIIFSPAWVSYAPCAALAGARVVYVPMNMQTTAAELRAEPRPRDLSAHQARHPQHPEQPNRPGVDGRAASDARRCGAGA